MPYIDPQTTVRSLLETRAIENGEDVVCEFDGRKLTYADLDRSVNSLANRLLEIGVRKGDRVAVMLGHHPDHVRTIFAAAKIGAVLVPINVHLKGASLEHLLEDSEPKMVIAEAAFADTIRPALSDKQPSIQIWRGREQDTPPKGELAFVDLIQSPDDTPPPAGPKADDLLAICYTSGTTGPPKGVLVTDLMYRAAATSCLAVSGIKRRDRLLFWEPLYHLFGIEILVLAVMQPVTLAMIERFSASRFWGQARRARATHIHYVGGVLQLLLKQPPSALDRSHDVRVAWGGGCPAGIWREFEDRFGVDMRDGFGMTESASMNIINIDDEPGALGRPLPYYEARVLAEDGTDAKLGEVGELLLREKEPGLLTKGYYRNPDATAKLLQDGWLHTGDLARRDRRGVFFFSGRKKDSVRRRGENVSAWEVERVVNQHPAVAESALVGVTNEYGDEDLKLFVKPTAGAIVDPRDLLAWCQDRLAKFQIPRFVAVVDHFDKTPTTRIRKQALSRSLTNCYDAESVRQGATAS